MIVSLRGTLLERTEDGAVVEAGGVGYAVQLSAASRDRLPPVGAETFLHVAESVAMYGGGTTFYGFLTPEEKRVFTALKDNVPGAGAKKALDLLDKAAKSLPDFRRAILDKDVKGLVTLFGFTSKTAEKLVAGLQKAAGEGLLSSGASPARGGGISALNDVIQGLIALGYRDADARGAAQSARAALGAAATSQDLIRESLRHLSGRG